MSKFMTDNGSLCWAGGYFFRNFAGRSFRKKIILILLIIFSSFSSYAIASIQEKRDIPKMVQRSDLIIRGKVISTESQWKEDSRGRHIYTSVTVKILDKIKGNIKDGAFAFEVVGGIVDDIGEVVSGTPAFEIDEDAIVFLAGHPLTIQHGTNGKILIYDGRVYRDDLEVTVDSFIQSLKILEQDPNAPVSLGEKYQAPTAEATAVPIIANISSDDALAGTNKQVTITGANFGSTQGSSKVGFFNISRQQKIPASIVSWSNTQIICTVPAGTTSAGSSLVIVTTSDGTSSGYVIEAAECFIYNGYKWFGTPPIVPYKINENTSDCIGEGAAVQRAAATWNNACDVVDFTFDYGGSCSGTGSSQNSINCITWGTTGGSLATAYWWYYPSTKEIFECDVVFNDGYTWSTDADTPPSKYDVESVALHEFGHWLNLADLYDPADSDKVMYGYLMAGEEKRDLRQCDIDGICYIYGCAGDCGGAAAGTCSVKEDFETGDFTKARWVHSGDANWAITSLEQNAGTYSAKAGAVTHNQSSMLEAIVDCNVGNITFYRKVSSELGWDYLTFYIDEVEKDSWSGTQNWAQVSFPVAAGTRTFKWTYSKDGSISSGSDTAWIDDIEYPIDCRDCNTMITIGTDTSTWSYPMHTYFHDSRTQVIYLAGEIGMSVAIEALALDVATVPGQTMNNWTIRMKHTGMSFYSPASLDATGSGWTVVYQGNEPAGSTGWRTFTFSAPFEYNGSDNLLVDFSHNNSSYTSNGTCTSSSPGGTRSAYAYSDSGYGDPLTWSGTSSPSVYGSSNVPDIQLIIVCIPGDFDNNGAVDFADFTILGSQWRQSHGSPSADIAPEIPDGFVDIWDLAAFVGDWLEGANP